VLRVCEVPGSIHDQDHVIPKPITMVSVAPLFNTQHVKGNTCSISNSNTTICEGLMEDRLNCQILHLVEYKQSNQQDIIRKGKDGHVVPNNDLTIQRI